MSWTILEKKAICNFIFPFKNLFRIVFRNFHAAYDSFSQAVWVDLFLSSNSTKSSSISNKNHSLEFVVLCVYDSFSKIYKLVWNYEEKVKQQTAVLKIHYTFSTFAFSRFSLTAGGLCYVIFVIFYVLYLARTTSHSVGAKVRTYAPGEYDV